MTGKKREKSKKKVQAIGEKGSKREKETRKLIVERKGKT